MGGRRLRVVELAEGVAGPVCARLFAALGHDVVKVERPGGDALRRTPPFFRSGFAAGESIPFHHLALGKRLVPLDVDTVEGRAALDALLGGADVLVLDLLPEAARLAGLTAAALHDAFPSLTVVSVTAFGQSGTHADLAGDSLLAEAFGGLVSMIGEPDGAPLTLGGRQAEYSAGVAAFLGACVALAGREDDGATSVDVAAADVAAYFDWKSETSVRTGGRAPIRTGRGGRWKLFEARDGHVGFIYQPSQWDLVCRLVPVPELRDERFATQAGRDRNDAEWSALVGAWVAGQSAADLSRRGQEIGLPLEPLATVADVVRSPQLAARGFLRRVGQDPSDPLFPGSPVPGLSWNMDPVAAAEHATWATAPDQAPPWWRRGTADQPLRGVTVLDMGQITAGAALSRLLADFGARVIKIESPRQPDPMRAWGSLVADESELSPLFPPNNVGKEAIALDLKTARGRELFLQLAAQSDVVVENFAAGVTKRLGVGYEEVRAVNDRIVYASLSGHGQEGPLARHKSYGSTLDLVSGAASVTGHPGRPTWSSFDLNYPDQLVSLYGAALVVHSLLVGRRGVYLDISQAEVVVAAIGETIAAFDDSGEDPRPTGNARAHAWPHDVFRCAGDDEWVAVSVVDEGQRRALGALVGATGPEDLVAALGAWTAVRDKRVAAAELGGRGVAAVPVLTARERHDEPRFRARGVFSPIGDPSVKGTPFVLLPAPVPMPRPAPELGQDTERILAELCGVGPDDHARLVEDGVVRSLDREEQR